MQDRRRIAILAEGCFTPRDAKTAVGVLRYRPDEVVAVIDSTRAGRTTGACAGVGAETPIVADLDGAATRNPNALLIGIAPQGGELPAAWRAMVCDALERGWDVLSGLHVFLEDDPGLRDVARRGRATIHDVRRPPAGRPVGSGRAREVDAHVVLTVGTDCNVGKMTAALEIERELLRRGERARFVATGQTGILIAGRGVPADAVVSDFLAGAIEREVLEAAGGADVLLVEGQGSLHHPGYSAVTLGILHGACPSSLVLCHWAGRQGMTVGGARDALPVPTLEEAARAAETASEWGAPARVIGLALNTLDLDEKAALEACRDGAARLGVPATDPVRFGAASLAEAVIEARARSRRAKD
jgi:uncharacterized NAD-dependent epimerase/dehydratase family protein